MTSTNTVLTVTFQMNLHYQLLSSDSFIICSKREQTSILQRRHTSTWFSWLPRLRTAGLCWSKVLPLACWHCWHLVHCNDGEDATVLVSDVTYTASVPHCSKTQLLRSIRRPPSSPSLLSTYDISFKHTEVVFKKPKPKLLLFQANWPIPKALHVTHLAVSIHWTDCISVNDRMNIQACKWVTLSTAVVSNQPWSPQTAWQEPLMASCLELVAAEATDKACWGCERCCHERKCHAVKHRLQPTLYNTVIITNKMSLRTKQSSVNAVKFKQKEIIRTFNNSVIPRANTVLTNKSSSTAQIVLQDIGSIKTYVGSCLRCGGSVHWQ